MTAHGSGEPHVVVVGGGFAGLNAARELGGTRARVTLLDRRNHHLFQPLLYQVATAALNPADVATPIRTILRKQKNTRVLLEEVSVVCPAERKVVFRDGRGMAYDYLIVATGATHSYFGHEEWARVAPGLKSIEDALEIRRRMLLAYEAAEREEDPELRGEWLTFVVIGGGPTGVELAGAFAEIALHAMRRDFRNIDPTQARIVLIEGLPRVLPTYPEDLSEKATRQLRRFGVEVRTGKLVSGIDERGATVGEERIAARTVVWAAGVQASALAKSVGAPLDDAGRVRVEPDLSVPGHPELFVVGDLAALEQNGEPVPGVAPAAIQEGRHAARQIRRDLAGRERAPFRYRNRGSLATIGRAAAVGELGRLHLSGWPAWMAWLVIHIYFLIGFRNRLFVMLQWAWAYATQKRGARLITGDRAGEPGPSDSPRHECGPQKERS